MIRQLAIRDLRLDGDTQSRAALDEYVISEYNHLYRRGVKLPPLLVFYDGTDHWLVDGFHRWWGADHAELTELPCEIREGSREDARWAAAAANQTHGHRRSNADKEKAVRAALRHPKAAEMSDSAVAEHVGVSHPFVGKIRKELTATCNDYKSDTRTGRDGRTINTAKIGKAKAKAKRKPDRWFKSLHKDVQEMLKGLPCTFRAYDMKPLVLSTKAVQYELAEILRAGHAEKVADAKKLLHVPTAATACPECEMHIFNEAGDCLVCRGIWSPLDASVMEAGLDEMPEPPEAPAHADADGTDNITCPTCGNNTFDVDGDCSKCHEPDVLKPSPRTVMEADQATENDEEAFDSDTEEVLAADAIRALFAHWPRDAIGRIAGLLRRLAKEDKETW